MPIDDISWLNYNDNVNEKKKVKILPWWNEIAGTVLAENLTYISREFLLQKEISFCKIHYITDYSWKLRESGSLGLVTMPLDSNRYESGHTHCWSEVTTSYENSVHYHHIVQNAVFTQ